MIDRIEKLGQVQVYRDAIACLDVGLYLPDRLVCLAAGSEAEARYREGRPEDRCQHLRDGLLDDPVQDGRDAQQPFAPVRLRDGYPTHRLRGVSPLFDPARARPASGSGRRRESPRGERHRFLALPGWPSPASTPATGCRGPVRRRVDRVLRWSLRLGSRLGSRQPPRHLPRSGPSMSSRSSRLLLVFRCSALQPPDSRPPTRASADS